MVTHSGPRSDHLLANNHPSRTQIILTVTVLNDHSPGTDVVVLIRHSGDHTVTMSVLLQELITDTERHEDDKDDEAVVALVGASHTPHHLNTLHTH